MAQVRKDQRLTQRDIADYMAVSLATVRKWEGGTALPDRTLWPRLEEAMGIPVPDPRVPEHTPAERELIDTILLLVDEMRLLRTQIGEGVPGPQPSSDADDSKLLDVNRAASYLGVSTSFIRNQVAQRTVVHYKLGGRVMFRRTDLDKFVDESKRETGGYEPWQLRGRKGRSPRRGSE